MRYNKMSPIHVKLPYDIMSSPTKVIIQENKMIGLFENY